MPHSPGPASEPRILLDPSRIAARRQVLPPDPQVAWRWIGWFALLLTLAALSDWVLAWVPLRFGSPEWEFGTIVSSYAGLPLLTMGFAGMLGSAVARGIRWQIVVVAVVMLTFAALLLAALAVFALDVPIALRAVQGPAQLGIVKATIKTGVLGALFAGGYAIGAITALRHLRSSRYLPATS